MNVLSLPTVIRALKKKWPMRYAVVGIPGIGKTMWSNYMLKLCYDEGIVVVQHDLSTNQAALLVPGEPAVKLHEKEIADTLLGYGDRHPLYLCDTGKNARVQPVVGEHLEGVLVVTTSPDPNHFGQWDKDSFRKLWLAPWTRAELKTALPHLLQDSRPEVVGQVLERYDLVGGSLRQLTATDGALNEYLASAKATCEELTVDGLAQLVSDVHRLNDKSQVHALNMSHKVLHVWPSPLKEGDTSVQKLNVHIATPFVREILVQAWYREPAKPSLLSKLLGQLQGCGGSGGWQGWIYELAVFTAARTRWMGGHVEANIWRAPTCSGAGSVRTCKALERVRLKEWGEDPRTVPVAVRQVVRLTRYVSAEDTATLLEPYGGLVVQAPEGFGGVDGWVYVEMEGGRREIWMLQTTIASSHKVLQSGLGAGVQHARRGSWAKAPYRLVFVVPAAVRDCYRNDEQAAPRVGREAYVDPWSGRSTNRVPEAGADQGGHVERLLDGDRWTARSVQSAADRVGNGDGRLPPVVWELTLDAAISGPVKGRPKRGKKGGTRGGTRGGKSGRG